MPAPLIVFSHLRWDFVYQRPQHLLSRMARHRKVIFIEEPVPDSPENRWEKSEPETNVLVCRPYTVRSEWGFADEQVAILGDMVRALLADENVKHCAVWFYTPMALPMLELCPQPEAVVFDVMDELSMFKGAPRELLDREAALLQRADVVFTGGPSLYRAKKDRAANVHCYPSSVDRAHFAQALGEIADAPEQAHLPRPRLGFYGVIDERMDLGLLDAMAAAHPEWQIVMVGPVVKISESDLPRRPNIHYVGQKSYKELPGFLKGWDVCLLPFALNDSTRFISPTKTVEYMAAERMVVSTPITDVVEPYGEMVWIAEGPQAFVKACEEALAADNRERARRIEMFRGVLAKTSWDHTADAMNAQIIQAINQNRAAKQNHTPASGPTRSEAIGRKPTVVIGAGPTGLAASYHLGEDALLIEKNDSVGGWCRSIEDNGFTFDYAGHIMFSKDPYVHEMYQMLLGDNVHWQDREAWIYSKGVYTRYPFQGCLYGLPADVITECIVGAIEARFGELKPQAQMEDAVSAAANRNGKSHGSDGNGNGHGNGHGAALASKRLSGSDLLSRCTAGDVKDCCGDGVMEAEVHLASSNGAGHAADDGKPKNFEEFIYKTWGKGIAKHFAIPYNRKIWAVDLKEMETSWLGGRVPMPDIEEMIRYSLTPACKPMGPNARFGYPLEGGFQALMNGFLPHLKGELRLNTAVIKVSPSRHTVTTSGGEEIVYNHLISTMPLPVLVRILGDEAPRYVKEAAAGLRHTSIRNVNLGIGRENVTDKHWIYYPEDTVFHRIFVQGNASPRCNAPGGFGITCEISYGPNKPLPCEGEALIRRCIEDCRKVGMICEDDEIWAANEADMPYAYVIYDHDRARNVKTIREWLLRHDILLAGRYSEWEYYNSDHAFVAGRNAANTVRELQRARASAAEMSSRVAMAV